MNRLKDTFKPGQYITAISADWLNTVARWLNSISVNGGPRLADPYNLRLFLPTDYTSGGASLFAWRVEKSDDLKYTIETGDIEVEPDTVIPWGAIIDDDTSVVIPTGNLEKTIPEGETAWFVWVKVIPQTVTIDGTTYTQGARLFDGNSITELTQEEKQYTIQRRIAEIAITENVITRVENLQCGNIDTSASPTGATTPDQVGVNDGEDEGVGALGSLLHVYAFECYARESRAGIVMEPGDVWLGPLTVVHWASITNATQTPALTSTNTCVWLEINVEAETASMLVGSRADMEAALNSTEQLNTLVAPIVETTWSDSLIVRVKNLQCGDVLIPRAAG